MMEVSRRDEDSLEETTGKLRESHNRCITRVQV